MCHSLCSMRRSSALPRLQVEQFGVRFGGLLALQDVDLSADEGEITGLIGPNGAGKTTLFNVVTGLQEPTGGRVAFDAAELQKEKPHERARRGIARTFQRLEVVGSLTTRENIMGAAEIRSGWSEEKGKARAGADEGLDTGGVGRQA